MLYPKQLMIIMASRLSDGMEASCYSPCPVFSVARDETTFIVGCALVGLAGGSIYFGSFTVIPSIAVPDTRDACAGLAGAVWGVASVIGLLVEGRYMSHAFWRWCMLDISEFQRPGDNSSCLGFDINLPFGGALTVIIAFFFIALM
ncbi:uncharacterized protein EAE98_011268 [Botrytis deweyae]|uniref:Major facilitator superfamily (MFS) profile domain-containing protein n=1 Tax=Botrytis deweyae TaxID=2478750 RepID=A0ABQ7I685_9HELO|nr:uncharacterized protein EAE98_011268 [Botrytis deweyae]KAF7915183.1 hypothetical protein EAE98_011268 [Botrytis deweyae]